MYTRFAGGAFEFHYTGSTARKMPDIVRNVDVGLEELLAGSSGRAITVHRQRFCSHCHGSGAQSEDNIETCPVCQGSGFSLFLSEHKQQARKGHHHHHHHHHHHYHHQTITIIMITTKMRNLETVVDLVQEMKRECVSFLRES